MDDDFVKFLAALAFGCLCGAIGSAIEGKITRTYYESAAVQRGFALHCPDDGEWAWKGECGE